MNRCQVSEDISKHCNQPEEAECPKCNSTMTSDDCGDLICDDQYRKLCAYIIYAPDEGDE